MEFILKGYQNFLGDAVLVFNKLKELPNSNEALNIYNYYIGEFFSPTENLNLKALQKSPILSNLQEIEAYNIVGEHLEEAINTIQKSHILP